ncbi:3'-5' exonuclease [Frankia sp. Cj3]|uniref:3'-5' exonuclease n=1 Tax=Frankia sp. Cj3 TaxID=2880976 RepID=UPI001EF6CF53|nr:3'-5' exonuclease [Frankia sp. Cj3]
MTLWWEGDILSFDLETTGLQVETARIVTAAVVQVGPTGIVDQRTWLVNPGIDIPAEATAIHGVTTERARAEGEDPVKAVLAILVRLAHAWVNGLPVVIMNASYDLTVLDRELRRNGYPGLAPADIGPIIDPLIIDRAMDKRRRGPRKLEALAVHYGVRQDGAHDALGDCLTAARVVWRQIRQYPELGRMSLPGLQVAQAKWHAEWAAGYEQWLRAKSGRPDAVIEREWPLRGLSREKGR